MTLQVDFGGETLLVMRALAEAIQALADAYQRGGAAEGPKAARTGTDTSPLHSTGEGPAQPDRAPAPVASVQPPSPDGAHPPAKAAPGGGNPGCLDVSSLTSPPAGKTAQPAAFFGRGKWPDAAREIVRREWPKGTPVDQVQKMLAEIGWHRATYLIGVYAATSLKVYRPDGFTGGRAKRAGIVSTANDVPSVAALIEHRALADASGAPIALQDAINWGIHNRIERQEGETVASLLERIAAGRRRHDLPPFRIIPPRTLRAEALPGPTFGGGDDNDRSKPRA